VTRHQGPTVFMLMIDDYDEAQCYKVVSVHRTLEGAQAAFPHVHWECDEDGWWGWCDPPANAAWFIHERTLHDA